MSTKKLTEAEIVEKGVYVGEAILKAFSEIRTKHGVSPELIGYLILPALKYSGVMLGGNITRRKAKRVFFEAFDLGERITGTSRKMNADD